MSFGVRKTAVWSHVLAAVGVLAPVLVMAATAAPAAAQGTLKLAVIDVNRIMTDSARGKAVLAGIEKLQSERSAQLKTLNEELTDMQKRFQEGRLSLAEDKLAELQAQIEEKDRAFKRAREDAERDVQKRRADEIEKIETAVFPIINGLGKEGGYTMIFNKFQSGLVYADDAVDITDEVIKRLDGTAAGSSGR
jgi:outer membrane protein